jgi:hypothetical protein
MVYVVNLKKYDRSIYLQFQVNGHVTNSDISDTVSMTPDTCVCMLSPSHVTAAVPDRTERKWNCQTLLSLPDSAIMTRDEVQEMSRNSCLH